MEQPEEWLTLKEAAEVLKIGQMTLWKWRRQGRIKDNYPFGRPDDGDRQGNHIVRIARSEIDRFMKDGGGVVKKVEE